MLSVAPFSSKLEKLFSLVRISSKKRMVFFIMIIIHDNIGIEYEKVKGMVIKSLSLRKRERDSDASYSRGMDRYKVELDIY